MTLPPQHPQPPALHHAPTPTVAQSVQTQALDSHLLLQGQREILISHNGVVYRLQATRQGKLILTK